MRTVPLSRGMSRIGSCVGSVPHRRLEVPDDADFIGKTDRQVGTAVSRAAAPACCSRDWGAVSMTSPAAPNGQEPIGVAVIGAGYWGPNLARNFAASGQFRLVWVADLDESRARRAIGSYSTVQHHG